MTDYKGKYLVHLIEVDSDLDIREWSRKVFGALNGVAGFTIVAAACKGVESDEEILRPGPWEVRQKTKEEKSFPIKAVVRTRDWLLNILRDPGSD